MTRAEYNEHIQSWSGSVLRFAVWNCGDRMRGEDAMQEAFASLWEIKEQVSVEKGLGFLLTAARRYLIDCFRHDTVVARAHQDMARDAQTSTGQPYDGLSDEMAGALASLPEIQRSILQLRDVDGYSYKEISRMLDISDQQVQVYLFRARTTMRKKLSKPEL